MNQTDYKIRNLESQILYLQQEHASTLKLLHNEIKDLQMKNSEMSFQLAMINVNSKDGDIPQSESDNTELLEQVAHLKDEVSTLNSQLCEKIVQLEKFDKQIHQLTETINKIKESHKTELASLEVELSNKSADIVHLSTKLFNLNHLLQSKSVTPPSADSEPLCPQSPFISQPPIAPKTFKFRNQISVHPDNTHLRRRPIIARQTMISTSVPIKSMVTQPLFPEYAVSIEDRAIFSKSIKRPSILPPINSTRHRNVGDNGTASSHLGQDPSIKALRINHCSELASTTEKLSGQSGIDLSLTTAESKIVHLDHFMDVNNSSLISSSSSTKPFNWTVTKNSSS